MMNCDKAQLLLSEYIDGTLEPGVKKEIDDFLKSDDECGKIFANAMSVQNRLKSLSKVTASKEFEVNLRNRILDLNSGNEKQPAFNKKGLSLVFSGAVLVTALYMFVSTDVGTQQNISDEILPSSTISNTAPSIADDKIIVDQQDESDPVADTDSTKNLPEKVDNSGIHLTGDGK